MYFFDNSNIMNKISKETVQISLDCYFFNISGKFLKLDKDHLVSEVATPWRWMTLNVLLLPVWASCFSQEVEFLCPHIKSGLELSNRKQPKRCSGTSQPQPEEPWQLPLATFWNPATMRDQAMWRHHMKEVWGAPLDSSRSTPKVLDLPKSFFRLFLKMGGKPEWSFGPIQFQYWERAFLDFQAQVSPLDCSNSQGHLEQNGPVESVIP